jgi:hypothetical protein
VLGAIARSGITLTRLEAGGDGRWHLVAVHEVA